MSELTAFRSLLLADEAITTEVGTRIYPQVSTSATYPQIVLTVVSRNPRKVLHQTSPMDSVRLQVSIYSPDYEEAVEIGHRVREAVDDYAGTVAGVSFARISYETGREVFEPGLEVHHNATDYTLLIHR